MPVTDGRSSATATAAHHNQQQQQSTCSLTGCSAASLDSESLALPDDLSDDHNDDVSSLYDFSLYASSLAPSTPGNSALYVDTAFEDSTLARSATVLNDETKPYDGDGEGGAGGTLGAKGKKRRYYLPSWLLNTSPAIKATIVVSSSLLVGSIVLVAVAVIQRKSSGGGDHDAGAATTQNQNPPFGNGPAGLPTGQPSVLPTAATDVSRQSQSLQPTIQPFADPTDAPTTAATYTPTQSPSLQPTVQQGTDDPTAPPSNPTTEPTSSPTVDPTPPPSVYTSNLISIPTKPPTQSPQMLPTAPPTLSPTILPTVSSQPSSEITTTAFYVIGGSYNSSFLADKVATLPTAAGDFLVHLGDWNANPPSCDEDIYASFAGDILSASSVPVYIIPGDNEYNDCLDPNQALVYWKENFEFYDITYWPKSEKFDVTRSAGKNRRENFAFAYRNVLYVGINLVGGFVHDENEWTEQIEDDIVWIRGRFRRYQNEIKLVTIFQHASPEEDVVSNYTDALYYYLLPDIIKLPVLIVHKNRHSDVLKWNLVQNPRGVAGVKVLEVVDGSWPPVRVEIDTVLNVMQFDQDSWYDPNL